MNKRLLIALVLSFLVLTVYGYLMPKQEQTKEVNKTEISKKSTAASTTSTAPTAPVASSAPNTANSTSKANAPEVPAKSNSKIIATIESEKYTLKIDSLGRVDSVVLKEKKYRDDNGKAIDLINKDAIKPLEIRFKDSKLNSMAFQTDYTASSKALDASKSAAELTLTQKLDSVTVKKILKFYPDGHYDLKTLVDGDKEYFITPGFRPTVDSSMYMVVRGYIIVDNSGVSTTLEDGDVKENKIFNNTVIAAAEDRYYTSFFFKKDGVFDTVVSRSGIKGYEDEPIAFVPAKGSATFLGYIGAKEWKVFENLDPKLTKVVEFGWFTFLSRPFFRVMLAIYDFVGNWGWAIVLFTLLVKIVLFPLSYKGLMSMQKLKDLAPKMKELKEKYGKDPAKMNQQMMALYKKHGANPMGGCLPMLLQIPIFFALYRVLLNADELQGAPWVLWISDLSRQDPYFVLPILMGITMYIQQKITPNTMTDPTQKKIFQWLPVIMTFFFLTFPSGLVLYWLVNNILTIAQQYYINGAYERYKLKAKAAQS
jgi:YidC/Oxa1 family membrane protein insertase